MVQYRKIAVSLLISLLIGGLFACSGVETRVEDKNVRLQQRLEGYLAVRKAADIIEMQKYFRNPGQARVGSVVYKDSDIISLEMTEEGQKAETKLKNTIQAMGFTFDKVPQTLYWIWYEKDWYLVIPVNSTHPFGKTQSKELPNNGDPKK